jgi:hypothetical protein
VDAADEPVVIGRHEEVLQVPQHEVGGARQQFATRDVEVDQRDDRVDVGRLRGTDRIACGARGHRVRESRESDHQGAES